MKQLVSIVIPTVNKKEMLEVCIKRVFENTSQAKTPFEVIVVDDGSTEDLSELTKKYDIKLVKNDWEENGLVDAKAAPGPQGFPSACNAGGRVASGDFICLLNNDCFVTDGWLEAMLRCIRSDSSLAAVGPYANKVSGYQGVDFKKKKDLDAFSKKFTGPEKYVDHLVFFCALIRKDEWDRQGGLCEEFNPGNFEDNYFCWRALRQGRRLKTVSHFVWHEGGQTFGYNQTPEKNIAYIKLMAHNQKKYCHLAGKYKTISLCMIVGDYEDPQILRRCLNSVAPFADELNIVFNYKTLKRPWKLKKLQEVAYSYRANVKNVKTEYIKFKDFASARNVSLDMAAGEYVLWVDTDDVCLNPAAFREAIDEHPEGDYFKCRIISKNPGNRGSDLILHNRLLKNKPEYRFKNTVHEDISISLIEKEARPVLTEIMIEHLGYLDPKLEEKKNTRNMKLLEKEILSPAAHQLTYYHLVNSLLLTGNGKNNARVIKLIDECLEKFPMKNEDPLLSKMWILRGLACIRDKQPAAAKQSFIKALLIRPDQPEAKINYGCILLDEGDIDGAIRELEELFSGGKFNIGQNMAFNFKDIENIMVRTLGDAYFKKAQAILKKTGKEKDDEKAVVECFNKAQQFYRMAMSLNPRQIEIGDRLCQILRATKQHGAANELTVGLVNVFPGYYAGWFNLAQTELFQKRYETAKVFLEKTIKINPKHAPAKHNLRIINAMGRAGIEASWK